MTIDWQQIANILITVGFGAGAKGVIAITYTPSTGNFLMLM